MKKSINSIIKRAYGTTLMLLALAAGSCASEGEPLVQQGMEQDEDGMIMLNRELKVKANTNFTMEEFEQEFFSNDTWEEVTIAEYKDGIWSYNFLAKPGYDGWYYQSCYEFHDDGTAILYHFPYDFGNSVLYSEFNYSIDPVHKSITFFTKFIDKNGQEGESSGTYKIFAVDEGRIVLDGLGLRKSIEPHEKIKGEKNQIVY